MHTALRRRAVSGAAALTLPLVALSVLTAPAQAVNPDYGTQIVSQMPKRGTPHVMNGAVQAITQVGNKVIVGGTFTSVSPADTFSDTSDDLVRNRLFAFDATTGVIDATFNPNMGGEVRSLDTDGTSVYVAGAFGSVGGKTGFKRVVKLSAAGVPDTVFKAIPSAVTNEVVVRGSRVYIGGAFVNVKSRTTTYDVDRLAVLDATRGTPDLGAMNFDWSGVYNTSAKNPGVTNVKRFDVTADGTRLAAIGNFTTISGQTRNQLAVFNVGGATSSLTSFATNRFDRSHSVCSGSFDTFTRDLDFSPDGSFFVVSNTGAFGGGASANSLCDTTQRWETNQTGNDPTWIGYTGGDTSYGVAITGDVVYIGGHMRWQNNPYQGDNAGPGAVSREGIAALDVYNGVPVTWNPGRDRGVGAQALFATPSGLWVGSDTTLFNNQRRGRVAFLPLADAAANMVDPVPAVPAAQLKGQLYAFQTGTPPANVLYRTNAGVNTTSMPSTDGGPAWSGQNGRVSGGSSSTYTTPVTLDPSVPASTPPSIFLSERYGQQDWNFNVPSGRDITVRLYFANQYDGTSQAGQRKFDVLIDNVNRLDDFDVAAAAGHRVGIMRSFSISSDGNVDIDLRNVVENAVINGIEIIDNNASAGTPGGYVKRPVDATGAPTGPAETLDGSDWSKVRGAFVMNGTLYYGMSDNAVYTRSFDASTGALGAASPLNLYDDPDNGARIPWSISNMTGMFYDPATHRIYYTVSGDSRLYYRGFSPQSKIVGALTMTGDAGGINFSTAAGLTLADGRIYYGSSTDGVLRSAPFGGGRVTGAPTVVSSDGTWKLRALFLPNG